MRVVCFRWRNDRGRNGIEGREGDREEGTGKGGGGKEGRKINSDEELVNQN